MSKKFNDKITKEQIEKIHYEYMQTLKRYNEKVIPHIFNFLKDELSNCSKDLGDVQFANWSAQIIEDCFIMQCDYIDKALGIPPESFFKRLQKVDLKSKNLWDGKNIPN